MKHLTAWRYDPRSCALLGGVSVPPVVLHDRLVYELPPHSTLVEPPDREPGKCPVWMEPTQRWVVVSDHRGEKGWVNWKGEEITILRLGDPQHWHLRRLEDVA